MPILGRRAHLNDIFSPASSYHYSGATVVNQGTIEALNGGTLVIAPAVFSNQGTVSARNGALLDVRGSVQVDNTAAFTIDAVSTEAIAGNLLGGIQDPQHFQPRGTVKLDGPGTTFSPQRLVG